MEIVSINNNQKKHSNIIVWEWIKVIIKTSIPIFGFFYLIYLCFIKKRPLYQKYAQAMLIIKLVTLICIIILGIIGYHIMIPYYEKLVDYLELL